MLVFNKNTIKDKIYACWLGKNIGGTMGTPFEGRTELNDIQGFSTPENVVLANDDLDLQLVWLRAIEDYGPYSLNEQILGKYWISYIPPHWNEYGIGKNNMRAGLLPPMSGEYNNPWKHSNGAWIRTEVWACMAPGCPDIAIKYAGAVRRAYCSCRCRIRSSAGVCRRSSIRRVSARSGCRDRRDVYKRQVYEIPTPKYWL